MVWVTGFGFFILLVTVIDENKINSEIILDKMIIISQLPKKHNFNKIIQEKRKRKNYLKNDKKKRKDTQ